ncbi:hypothetical protein [Methyloceanibacter methanicus]|uniref:hypothetical protein n=1 Tax=Methyloceanibacter methanicus TaxID=1774968 RepID=UPI001FCD4B85|nr:hypothetical protein [Methyloceanibacter methanicus]
MFEDPLFWLLVAPGVLLGLYAQGRIKANVAKYGQAPTPRASRARMSPGACSTRKACRT